MTTSRTASAPAPRSSSAPGLLRSCGFSEEYELLFADELEGRHGQLRLRRTQRSRRIGDALKAAACLERESIQIRGQLKPETPGRGVVYTFSDQESGLPKIRRRGAGFDYICFSGRLTPGTAAGWRVVRTGFDESTLKICPHYLLSGYGLSVWVDRGTLLLSGPDEFTGLLRRQRLHPGRRR